jgi:hypothetical protein
MDHLSEKESCGVIYIATGAVYVDAAIRSAESVKQYLPDISIDLFTDAGSLESHPFDRIVTIDNPHRRSKVDYIAQSRFDRTLYLDSDTLVVDEIGDLFDLLERYDIVAAHAHARNRSATQVSWRKVLPQSFPQLNSGVLLFKKSDRVLKLFEDWRSAFHEAGFSKDQVTFRELVWDSDLALYILPPEYNIRYKKYVDVWEEKEARPKILHYAAFHREHESFDEKPSLFCGLNKKIKAARKRFKR